MNQALVKTTVCEKTSGLIPAIASAVLPGLGQIINHQTKKAVSVFLIWGIAGASFINGIPLLGAAASAVAGLAWLYGVVDGYYTGKHGPSED